MLLSPAEGPWSAHVPSPPPFICQSERTSAGAQPGAFAQEVGTTLSRSSAENKTDTPPQPEMNSEGHR